MTSKTSVPKTTPPKTASPLLLRVMPPAPALLGVPVNSAQERTVGYLTIPYTSTQWDAITWWIRLLQTKYGYGMCLESGDITQNGGKDSVAVMRLVHSTFPRWRVIFHVRIATTTTTKTPDAKIQTHRKGYTIGDATTVFSEANWLLLCQSMRKQPHAMRLGPGGHGVDGSTFQVMESFHPTLLHYSVYWAIRLC